MPFPAAVCGGDPHILLPWGSLPVMCVGNSGRCRPTLYARYRGYLLSAYIFTTISSSCRSKSFKKLATASLLALVSTTSQANLNATIAIISSFERLPFKDLAYFCHASLSIFSAFRYAFSSLLSFSFSSNWFAPI